MRMVIRVQPRNHKAPEVYHIFISGLPSEILLECKYHSDFICDVKYIQTRVSEPSAMLIYIYTTDSPFGLIIQTHTYSSFSRLS